MINDYPVVRKHSWLKRLLFAAAWVGVTAGLIWTQSLRFTSQRVPSDGNKSRRPEVEAASTREFIDAIGIATHWGPANQKASRPAKTALLANLGIHHVRDGANDGTIVEDLAPVDIHLTLVLDPPWGGVAPAGYWSNPPHHNLADFLTTLLHQHGKMVDAVEMPNELDVFYGMYKWHPGDRSVLSNDPKSPDYWARYGVAITGDSWKSVRARSELNYIKIIGPALGYRAKGYSAGSLFDFVDWGNFHAYPGGGNPMSLPLPYGGVPKYFWQTNQPTVNIDEWPYAFDSYQGAFSNGAEKKAMACTETGYPTGSSTRSVSEEVQARYVPRVFAEYFRHGVVRTFLYDFIDDGNDLKNAEKNFGIVHNDLSPKPAYTALASLLSLLKDSPRTFTPGSLKYMIEFRAAGAYNRPQYIHDLLLQKSNGDFYLLLWHEIASSSFVDYNGNPVSGTARDLNQPALPVSIQFPSSVRNVVRYTYDESWNLRPETLSSTAGKLTLLVGDSISVIRLASKQIS